jgi:hypothetical protein
MFKHQKKQLLVFPELSRSTDEHPSGCAECGGPGMLRHRAATRPVLGADETAVKMSGNAVRLGFIIDRRTGEIVGLGVLASRKGEEAASSNTSVYMARDKWSGFLGRDLSPQGRSRALPHPWYRGDDGVR